MEKYDTSSQFNDLTVPDPEDTYYCCYHMRSTGWTHLMKLVVMFDRYPEVIKMIEVIVKDKNEINKQNEKKWTALMLACVYSETCSSNVIVKILIDAGANVNQRCSYGSTALMIACEFTNSHSNIETMKLLINAGSNVNSKNKLGDSSLTIASRCSNTTSNIQTVKLLIDNKADVNNVNMFNRSVLMTSVENFEESNIETSKMLIDYGADINFMNTYRESILMISIKLFDNIETVKMLIDCGANVNYENEFEESALTSVLSRKYDKVEITKLLIKAGVDIDKIRHGHTFLMLSLNCYYKRDQIEFINFLIDAGANVNHKCPEKQTILMKLLDNHVIDYDLVVKLLHKSKLTLLDVNEEGKTAYDYYRENQYDFLDDHHLKLLKGEISYNRTKSANH